MCAVPPSSFPPSPSLPSLFLPFPLPPIHIYFADSFPMPRTPFLYPPYTNLTEVCKPHSSLYMCVCVGGSGVNLGCPSSGAAHCFKKYFVLCVCF